ncbi:hypothetical protein CSOJ01_02322 [Colletotrichum sojae]|uniref:Uncharacterized protein n=1 Tax=Colletotrichum sojae TaxID=2175907 RepID=A0A8H6JRA5_9PEZI|nr:hypothetical protein CSOJ01_02322 [Colletotrichum sojae]
MNRRELDLCHDPNTRTGRVKTAGKGSAGDILSWELPGPAAALWGETGGGAIWAQRTLAGGRQSLSILRTVSNRLLCSPDYKPSPGLSDIPETRTARGPDLHHLTAPQHHSTTAPQHHSTTAPQHHSTARRSSSSAVNLCQNLYCNLLPTVLQICQPENVNPSRLCAAEGRDALAGDPRPKTKSIRFLDPSNCRLPSIVPCWETQGFNVVRVAVVFFLSNREIHVPPELKLAPVSSLCSSMFDNPAPAATARLDSGSRRL